MEQQLQCENCGKNFIRRKYSISRHIYCSRSCAASVNNRTYPKRPAPVKLCTSCGKKFHKSAISIYCSVECRFIGQQKHTKKDILLNIRKAAKKLGRSPAKRELLLFADAASRLFGSWNNAVQSAGLKPHRSDDNRMYHRTKTKARDGHVCDSISEAIVDNWLAKHGIDHTRDAKYPTTNHRADWAIKDGGVFVEYFGLAKDSPRYDREIKVKKKLCKNHKIQLIEIYPSDLYPKVSLSQKLSNI